MSQCCFTTAEPICTDHAGLGVFSSWLGGAPGWLSGGWWFEKRSKTEHEVNDLKTKELSNGRLAM